MNAILVPVTETPARNRSAVASTRSAPVAAIERRRPLRTRRLAAALAAVLALGGLAGSAQAGTTDEASANEVQQVGDIALWAWLKKLWVEATGVDDESASISGDEGGSDDPDSGDPN